MQTMSSFLGRILGNGHRSLLLKSDLLVQLRNVPLANAN